MDMTQYIKQLFLATLGYSGKTLISSFAHQVLRCYK